MLLLAVGLPLLAMVAAAWWGNSVYDEAEPRTFTTAVHSEPVEVEP